MARGTGSHIAKERKEGPNGTTDLTVWCGDKYAWRADGNPYASSGVCPACSAKFFKANPPAGWTLEKLDLPQSNDDPNPWDLLKWGLKSAYLARHQGEAVALIMIDTGWGEKWRIERITAGWEDVDDETTINFQRGGVANYQPYHYNADGTRAGEVGSKYLSEAKRFNSKERALFELISMLADGHVKPESQLRADAIERMAKRREENAQRKIEDEQRERDRAEYHRQREIEKRRAQDELDLIAIAFAEMVTEGKISNFQREAVFLAAKRLGIEGLDQA